MKLFTLKLFRVSRPKPKQKPVVVKAAPAPPRPKGVMYIGEIIERKEG